MSNIFAVMNYGSVWRHNGKCYHLVGESSSPPTVSAISGDVFNYSAMLWTYDDDGEYEGESHRIWNDCEMCVANLPGNFGDGPATSGLWTGIFTAPSPGVFRIWMNEEASSEDSCVIKTNVDEDLVAIGESYTDATPKRLLIHEQVWYKSEFEIHFIFCPYLWPSP